MIISLKKVKLTKEDLKEKKGTMKDMNNQGGIDSQEIQETLEIREILETKEITVIIDSIEIWEKWESKDNIEIKGNTAEIGKDIDNIEKEIVKEREIEKERDIMVGSIMAKALRVTMAVICPTTVS